MAFTVEQLEAIEVAVASGTLKVQYSDRAVTYHSLRELLMLRDKMRRELGLIPARQVVDVKTAIDKGLG